MMNIEYLFLHYLLTSVAIFSGIICVILSARGIVYAKRLGGDGDIAGAKLRCGAAAVLMAASAASGLADVSPSLCLMLGCVIIMTGVNACLACADASLLVKERYERYAKFVTGSHADGAEPPVTPDRMELPLFFLEDSYEDWFAEEKENKKKS